MQPRVFSPLLALSLALVLLSGCAKKEPLVGNWKAESGSEILLLTFRSDQTFVLIDGGNSSEEFYGKWSRADPTTLVLVPLGHDDSPMNWDILSEGETDLSLRPVTTKGKITLFRRVSKEPQPVSAREKLAYDPAEVRRVYDERMAKLLDRAVLNNARQLSAAADQFFLETGRTSVELRELVGTDHGQYIKALNTVAHETYPNAYTLGMTITIEGIAGLRTITYAP